MKLHNSVLEIIFKRNIELVVDFNWFYKFRNYKDGISNSFELNFDFYRCDHSPQIRFVLIILNLILFDFQIYNKYHEDLQ